MFHSMDAVTDTKITSSRLGTARLIGILFAFLLVLTMQTVYVKLSGFPGSYLLNGLTVLVGILAVACSGSTFKKVVKPVILWDVLFLTVPVLHIIFINSYKLNIGAMILITGLCTVLFSICCFYVANIGYKKFLRDVASCIFTISAVSFALYLVGPVFGLISPTGTVDMIWGGSRTVQTYYYLLFTPQGAPYHLFPFGRFTGIFTEAPMCSFMLCVSLIVNLYLDNGGVRPGKLAVTLIAIFFTGSTTGYVVAGLAIAVKIFVLFSEKVSKKTAQIVGLALVAIGICCLVAAYLAKSYLDPVSANTRSSNMVNALNDFISSPLFGLGFKSDAVGVTGGNTSVLSNVLQQGGVLFFGWYFLPLIMIILSCLKNKKWNIIISLFLYLILLYATVVTYTGFSISVVALAYVAVLQGIVFRNSGYSKGCN